MLEYMCAIESRIVIFTVIIMLVVSIWCAHIAGAAYILSRADKKYRRVAILRSALSIAAATFIVYYAFGK